MRFTQMQVTQIIEEIVSNKARLNTRVHGALPNLYATILLLTGVATTEKACIK